MRLVVPGALLVLTMATLLPVDPEPAPESTSKVTPEPPGWVDLDPRERARALRNYCEFQGLPDAERQEIRTRYERWKRLSESERKEARLRWEASRSPASDPVTPPATLLTAETVSASSD